MRALSYIGAEKITFLPKPDIQTDRQTYINTDRRTDISVYRVASLLKNEDYEKNVQGKDTNLRRNVKIVRNDNF